MCTIVKLWRQWAKKKKKIYIYKQVHSVCIGDNRNKQSLIVHCSSCDMFTALHQAFYTQICSNPMKGDAFMTSMQMYFASTLQGDTAHSLTESL